MKHKKFEFDGFPATVILDKTGNVVLAEEGGRDVMKKGHPVHPKIVLARCLIRFCAAKTLQDGTLPAHNKRQTGARTLDRQGKFNVWLNVKCSLHARRYSNESVR